MGSSKFHISLNANDLRASAAFLELLLGTKPIQLHSNYAKFELTDPPLVLSLVPTEVPTNSGINHLGFRLPNRATLDSLQQRLQAAGIPHDIEESVACCHSRQSKFWVHDPMGNLWEFYVLEDSANCESKPVGTPTVISVQKKQPEAAVEKSWGHRLGTPIPQSIPAENGSLDGVVLEGTFNAQLADDAVEHILTEASRSLRAGGTLLIHSLTADRVLSTPPKLPGPASKVEHVPTYQELVEAIEKAGFVGIELVTFGESYTFTHAGAELRETKLQATRSGPTGQLNHIAIYRGPFAELRDDSDCIFRRGEPTRIDDETCRRLQNSSASGQFVLLTEAPAR